LPGYNSLVGGELTFGLALPAAPPLLLATAPRETFERAGTGRKASTGPREAIRRGHLHFPGLGKLIAVPRVNLPQ